MKKYYDESGVTKLLHNALRKIYIARPKDPKSILLDMIAWELNALKKSSELMASSKRTLNHNDPEALSQNPIYQNSPSFISGQHEIPANTLTPPIATPIEVPNLEVVVQGKF